MSRSYRKHAYATEGQNSPGLRKKRKRVANKRVRNEDTADGKAYRKVSNPWDICDFKFIDQKAKRK